ncbi:MAG: M48 family metallopeptidase, partial [Hyphomonadaceae bacterium]|nr:M48 family metallopeptidase [Hyphomonadaceae bacterium]
MRRALAAACCALALGAPLAAAQEADAPAPAPTHEFAPAPPPPSRVRPAPDTDEGGLWGLSERAEQEARAAGTLERDAALNAYLREVTCSVAAQYCGDVRLYVMNRPFFNASMAPNGYMEVWSGLLLRAEDEAQLAFVLGHEVAHYGERHSLSALRAQRARATGAMVATVAIAVVGAAAAVNSPSSAGSIADATRVATDAIYLGTIASLFAFSRENESEVDLLGFDHAAAAGYDPAAGGRLWTNLISETRASDDADVRRREARASIFASHPLSRDRLEALEERASAHAGGGETHRARYRAAIRPFLDPWLRAELRRRDFGQTLLLLDRLGAHGEDLGVVEYYRGEVLRLRRGEGDRAAARQHYENAITQANAPAA